MKLTFPLLFLQLFSKYWRPKYKEHVHNKTHPREHKQSSKKVGPGTPTTTIQRNQW